MALGQKWFGKTDVTLVGRDRWDGHDATKTWTDGGAVRQELDKAAVAIEKIVAENATTAVSEYASDAKAALRSTPEGEVILGLRFSNTEASQIVEIPLREVIVTALKEMSPKLGIDQDAQAVLSSLVSFGHKLVNLTQAASPGRPSPSVGRPPHPLDAPVNAPAPKGGKRQTRTDAETMALIGNAVANRYSGPQG